jgi:hypothetical protein
MENAKEKPMSKLAIFTFITSAVIGGGYLPAAAAQDSEASESRSSMEHRGMEHGGMEGMGKMGMKKMDRDGDGTVSKEEFTQTHEEMFDRMDEDRDGTLDENEMGGMGGCMMMR